ncbi:MAG: hypothetical protein GDA50_08425 [Alphaproteobacteria bacterium GM202ARS2]|nr:hypothetical protein [Alphaproteobacteria bacterium GM202ARS2]
MVGSWEDVKGWFTHDDVEASEGDNEAAVMAADTTLADTFAQKDPLHPLDGSWAARHALPHPSYVNAMDKIIIGRFPIINSNSVEWLFKFIDSNDTEVIYMNNGQHNRLDISSSKFKDGELNIFVNADSHDFVYDEDIGDTWYEATLKYKLSFVDEKTMSGRWNIVYRVGPPAQIRDASVGSDIELLKAPPLN